MRTNCSIIYPYSTEKSLVYLLIIVKDDFMVCSFCKKEIPTNSKICGYCGKKVTRSQIIKETVPQIAENASSYLPKDDIPICPFCYSASVIYKKRGFKWGRAAVGTMLLGPTAGYVAGKFMDDKQLATCLSCGRDFSFIFTEKGIVYFK